MIADARASLARPAPCACSDRVAEAVAGASAIARPCPYVASENLAHSLILVLYSSSLINRHIHISRHSYM